MKWFPVCKIHRIPYGAAQPGATRSGSEPYQVKRIHPMIWAAWCLCCEINSSDVMIDAVVDILITRM
ncbi:hypothetical protein LINPERPRIM_LOCUS37524 [Linum perenne]